METLPDALHEEAIELYREYLLVGGMPACVNAFLRNKSFLDVGLLVMKSGISSQTILSGEGNLFMGAVTENYVAMQLAAKGYPLYYWESPGTAELDFVMQKNDRIIGIEVKKGEHVRSRSLRLFIDAYHPAYSIRLSLKNFGEKDGLKSVPLYAAFCI